MSNSSSPSEPKHATNGQERGAYPTIKIEHSHSPTIAGSLAKSVDFKSPQGGVTSISNTTAHPLASSTIISSSNTSSAMPTSSPSRNGSVLPIKHVQNIQIEVKDTQNENQHQNSKDNTTDKSEPTVCEQIQIDKSAKQQVQNEFNNELVTMFGSFDEDMSHDMKGLKNVLLKLQSLV